MNTDADCFRIFVRFRPNILESAQYFSYDYGSSLSEYRNVGIKWLRFGTISELILSKVRKRVVEYNILTGGYNLSV